MRASLAIGIHTDGDRVRYGAISWMAGPGRTETNLHRHHARLKAVIGSRIALMWSTDSGTSGQRGRNLQYVVDAA